MAPLPSAETKEPAPEVSLCRPPRGRLVPTGSRKLMEEGALLAALGITEVDRREPDTRAALTCCRAAGRRMLRGRVPADGGACCSGPGSERGTDDVAMAVYNETTVPVSLAADGGGGAAGCAWHCRGARPRYGLGLRALTIAQDADACCSGPRGTSSSEQQPTKRAELAGSQPVEVVSVSLPFTMPL
jgi:hypothetical protein